MKAGRYVSTILLGSQITWLGSSLVNSDHQVSVLSWCKVVYRQLQISLGIG